jgi:transposase
MTQSLNTINPTIWVAIDMAKFKHDILIEYPNQSQKRLKIGNTKEEYQRLLETIMSMPHAKIKAGFEATADYHRCLAYFLQHAGIECCLISSIATARTREAWYQTWDKHDKKDTQVILHLLKSGFVQRFHDPLLHHYNDIQELSNTYHQVSKRKTRLLHSLKNHYLALYFPEAEKFLLSTRAHWLIQLLLKFPCPQSIKELTLEMFIKEGSQIQGKKRFKHQWLTEFYQIAQRSVGLPVSPESEAMQMFRSILQEYQALCERRDGIEQRAIQLLQSSKDFIRLQTVPGIGPIIALTILAEAGDLRRFQHYRQFIKFCGFNLCTQRSGTMCGQTKLSKRGNARLRQSLWMAAQIAVQQRENGFRKKFKSYLQQHGEDPDSKRKAYTAVAIKMARVIHSMVKQQTDYRGYYESP